MDQITQISETIFQCENVLADSWYRSLDQPDQILNVQDYIEESTQQQLKSCETQRKRKVHKERIQMIIDDDDADSGFLAKSLPSQKKKRTKKSPYSNNF